MSLIFQILEILTPIFFLVSIGYFWIILGYDFPLEFITRLIMNIAAPCLVFFSLSNSDISLNNMGKFSLCSVSTYVLIGFSSVAFFKLARLKTKTYFVPFLIGNTGNIGLPLILLSLGETGFSYALVLFSFSCIFTFTIGLWVTSSNPSYTVLFKQPLVWAALLGAIFLCLGLKLPNTVNSSLKLIGEITIPMMLMTLGVAVTKLKINNFKKGFWLTLARTTICIVCATSLGLVFKLEQIALIALVLQMATPASVTSYLLSLEFGSEPNDVASLVVVSTLMALLIIPIILAITLPNM